MKNLIFTVVLFFCAQLTYADISGYWSGQGLAKTPSYSQGCSNVFFKLSLTEEKFKIQEGGYNCNGLNAEYPYSVFNVVGPLLYYKNEVSGLIKDGEILIYSKDDGFSLRFKIASDGLLEVTEEWREGDDFLIIKSELRR